MAFARLKKTEPTSLKTRFIVLVTPLLLLINLVFMQLYLNQKKNELIIHQEAAKSRLLRQKEKIEQFSENILNDLNIILNHHELLSFIENEKNQPRRNLVHDLIQFAKFERIYDQIRYIDASGMEIIRINFNDGHPESIRNPSGTIYCRIKKNAIISLIRLN